MTGAEINAQMEAAWVLERETSPTVRALIRLYGDKDVYDIWAHGYYTGVQNGFQDAHDIYSRTA